MDKLSKLQQLLGDENVVDDRSSFRIPPTKNPMHLYEGTDSDEDMIREADVVKEPKISKLKKSKGKKATIDAGPQPMIRRPENKDTNKYSLELGELAAGDEIFCPWRAVKDFPWKFVGTGSRDKVVHAFYEEKQFSNEHWDFFYIHRASSDLNQQPIILVPTHQVASFLQTINETLGINLTVPTGGANAGFQLQFDNDGNPRPRYLGHSTNADMAQELHRNIPPSYFKPDGEPDALGSPSARSLAAFKTKMEAMMQLQKNKKAASAEKRKKERIERQKAWCHSIKRIQRYLGLRKVMEVDHDEIKAELSLYGMSVKGDYDVAVKAAITKLGPCAYFDPAKLAPYEAEADVVFVCVDVEAWERNSRMITEIGIATLDTRDMKDLIPGKLGENWMTKIRARHFRIKENAHLNNSEFVEGCADNFDFGESEFISIKDAAKVIASCFKHPFSDPNATQVADEDQPKREIILLGHDTPADVSFMQQLGYNVHNLSNLREIADTASMWRYLKREPNPRNLGIILYELDLAGWHLHNAGNDAVFTLQAMLGIAIKHIEDKQKVDKDKERKSRISDSVKEATEVVLEKEEGWSSSGENSDGGAPVTPSATQPRTTIPGTSKQAISRAAQPPAPASLPTPAVHQKPTQSTGPAFSQMTTTPPKPLSKNNNGWGVPSTPKFGTGSVRSKSLQAGKGNMSLQHEKRKDGGGGGAAKEETPDWDTYKGW